MNNLQISIATTIHIQFHPCLHSGRVLFSLLTSSVLSMTMPEEPELEEYEELEEDQQVAEIDNAAGKGYVGIHSVSFDDMQLKRELMRAIQDSGFEHPSESTKHASLDIVKLRHGIYPRCICNFIARSTSGLASRFIHNGLRECSSATMYPYCFTRPRCHRSGKIRHGEDSCLCLGSPPSTRATRRENFSYRHCAYA
jgi:hypothetical protein